jgi:GntR family histidine utilization transcriptional repressor
VTDAPDIALDGHGPLHLQIRRAIARPILSGAWAPGRRVPSEQELTARLQVSRMTVSRAMAALAEEGLIERRRKAGTVVASPRAEQAVFEIWDVQADAARRGAAHGFEVLRRREGPAGPAEAERLGLREGAPVLRIAGRHAVDGVPVQHEDRLVSLDAVPEIRGEIFAAAPPGRWLLDRVPWTEAEHVIAAAEASGEVAEALRLRPRAACLVVQRRTWRGAEPITCATLTSPAGAQRLVGRFRPGGG